MKEQTSLPNQQSAAGLIEFQNNRYVLCEEGTGIDAIHNARSIEEASIVLMRTFEKKDFENYVFDVVSRTQFKVGDEIVEIIGPYTEEDGQETSTSSDLMLWESFLFMSGTSTESNEPDIVIDMKEV